LKKTQLFDFHITLWQI